MTRIARTTVSTTLLSFVLCIPGTVATAADAPGSRAKLARTEIHTVAITWQPQIAYASAVLTIAGPGDFVMRREFSRQEAIQLAIDPKHADRLADGQYAYELRFSPVIEPEIREALETARATGDSSIPAELKRQGKLPQHELVQSGYFRIHGGTLVAPGLLEQVTKKGVAGQREERADTGGVIASSREPSVDDRDVATKDHLILDDLIVDGSTCIGFDCVNGESFGYDTIRLKENNLRIRAMDTSSVGSYASNDWQITFNDSANGGANKFSIDDIDGGRTPFTIEANAPSHSLYIEDYGRVGLGTSVPYVELHIADGDSPTVRLDQDGSSGWSAQSWDVAGNESNFFIRDVTNGSKLCFRIQPNTPTDTLTMKSSGRVGIGTWTPDAPLDVESGESFSFFRLTALGASPNTAADMTFTDGGASGVFRINIVDGDGYEAQIDHNGNLTVRGTVTTATQTIPDHVFDPDYKLLPLAELAEFIERERHLPNVPSNAEVQARGSINLNEMQLALLEKLEELTLYTLVQEGDLDDLREENEALMARVEENEALTARVDALERVLGEFLSGKRTSPLE